MINYPSDHGYSTSAVSMRCTACGSQELFCCDGDGNPLPEAVRFLLEVRSRLEQQRRFSSRGFNDDYKFLVSLEGDIEEWLIENGFQKSGALDA